MLLILFKTLQCFGTNRDIGYRFCRTLRNERLVSPMTPCLQHREDGYFSQLIPRAGHASVVLGHFPCPHLLGRVLCRCNMALVGGNPAASMSKMDMCQSLTVELLRREMTGLIFSIVKWNSTSKSLWKMCIMQTTIGGFQNLHQNNFSFDSVFLGICQSTLTVLLLLLLKRLIFHLF